MKKSRGIFRRKKSPEENEREIEEFFSRFEDSPDEDFPHGDGPYPDSVSRGTALSHTAQQEIDDFFQQFDDLERFEEFDGGFSGGFDDDFDGSFYGSSNDDFDGGSDGGNTWKEDRGDMEKTGIYDRNRFRRRDR